MARRALHSRPNPGELASVEREYEKLILKGIALVLWAHAYGTWAQQDIAARDPDVMDEFPRDLFPHAWPRTREAVSDALATAPVHIPTWMDHATATPCAAGHAAKDLAAAIAKSEEVTGPTPLATLFALAMEIDTGEPFEFVPIVKPPAAAKRPDTILLFDGGCHPQRFAEEMDRSAVEGVSAEEWETMAAGDTPDNEWIWDTWNDVEQHAVVTDKDGTKYTLANNNDNVLFLIPKGMEWDEKEDWYAWPEEDDDLHDAEQFGRDLAHMALDDGFSWFDMHKQTNGTMEWKPAIARMTVSFDGELLTWKLPDAAPKTENTERRVRITFESITPARVGDEDGDGEEDEIENGWEDEEGVVVEPDDDRSLAESTVRLIGGGNNMLGGRLPGIEPSSSSFHAGVWYTQTDGRTDYQTGEVRTLSYHLGGYTEEEEREVFDLVMGKTPIR